MHAAGIIVEYNPLHKGHIYHIKKTRELTGCDMVIAVMSGNFVQRGEPAFIDKYTRTRMALLSEVDLVLELPLIYSISSAEGFAFGGVSILEATGIVNSICFGSEYGSLSQLQYAADVLSNEPSEFKLLLKDYIGRGMSFPAARAKALIDYGSSKLSPLKDQLSLSNNILSIEYLKALNRLGSKIKPFTIQRIGSSYSHLQLEDSISSATAIRNNFSNPQVTQSMPDYVYSMIQEQAHKGKGPVSLSNLSDLILLTLRMKSIQEISQLLDVNEGLEYKIKRAAEDCGDVFKLIENVKSRRYPATRIQRILLYSLFNITKDAILIIKSPPSYIRVLGFNSKGREALSKIKSLSTLPVITNPSPKDQELMYYDLMASDVYSLCYGNPEYKTAKQDFKTPPVII